jgi:hypothetical protein
VWRNAVDGHISADHNQNVSRVKRAAIDSNTIGVQIANPFPAALGALVEFPAASICFAASPGDFAPGLALAVVVAPSSFSNLAVTVIGIEITVVSVSTLEPGKLAKLPPKLSRHTASEPTVYLRLIVNAVSLRETS